MVRNSELLLLVHPDVYRWLMESTYGLYPATLSDWEKKHLGISYDKLYSQTVTMLQIPEGQDIEENGRSFLAHADPESLAKLKGMVVKFALAVISRRVGESISLESLPTEIVSALTKYAEKFLSDLYEVRNTTMYLTAQVDFKETTLSFLIEIGRMIAEPLPPLIAKVGLAIMKGDYSQALAHANELGDVQLVAEIVKHIQQVEMNLPPDWLKAMKGRHFYSAARIAKELGNNELMSKSLEAEVDKCLKEGDYFAAIQAILEFEEDRDRARDLARQGLLGAFKTGDKKIRDNILSLFPELQVPIETQARPVKGRILPKGWWKNPAEVDKILDSIEESDITDSEKRKILKRRSLLHPERCEYLQQFEPNWYYSDRYLGSPFYVVAEIKGIGAFAECPFINNALYFCRSSWVEVFAHNKQGALEMGAIRIPHTKNWQSIVTRLVSEHNQNSSKRQE